MITSNGLSKLDEFGNIVPITTDDIPEGANNRYSIDWADGKQLGEVIERPNPDETLGALLLNGQEIYQYDYRNFYSWCLENKNKAINGDTRYDYFKATLDEWQEHYMSTVGEQFPTGVCPLFAVVENATSTIYEITDGVIIGYCVVAKETGAEHNYVPENCKVFKDSTLLEVVAYTSLNEYSYTGETQKVTTPKVKLPLYDTKNDIGEKAYYFIVAKSRVADEDNSIRSVTLGTVETLDPGVDAYIKNSGSVSQLVLDFGIPTGPKGDKGDVGAKGDKGDTALSLQIEETVTGEPGTQANVENIGTNTDLKLKFTIPQGPKGVAGGTTEIMGVVSQLPATANNNDIYFNKTDNKLYTYNVSSWVQSEPELGHIYVKDNILYYWNGISLEQVSGKPSTDDRTIVQDEEGTLTVIGVEEKNSQQIKYDWVGTIEEWITGTSDGTIPEDWICYITDDSITITMPKINPITFNESDIVNNNLTIMGIKPTTSVCIYTDESKRTAKKVDVPIEYDFIRKRTRFDFTDNYAAYGGVILLAQGINNDGIGRKKYAIVDKNIELKPDTYLYKLDVDYNTVVTITHKDLSLKNQIYDFEIRLTLQNNNIRMNFGGVTWLNGEPTFDKDHIYYLEFRLDEDLLFGDIKYTVDKSLIK